MGVVRTLSWRAGAPTVGEAVAAFLATLDHPETVGTRRVYASTLRQLRAHLGPEAPVAVLDDPAAVAGLAGWFTGRWGPAAPATFNRNLDALRSAAGYWRDQGWIASDPTRAIRRRGRARERTRALSRAVVDELDLRNRCAKVRRKGNAVDIIVWRTGAARLLPRMLKGRTTGPVFLTDRRARLMLPPGDLDPVSGRARLSYRRAAELFTAATGTPPSPHSPATPGCHQRRWPAGRPGVIRRPTDAEPLSRCSSGWSPASGNGPPPVSTGCWPPHPALTNASPWRSWWWSRRGGGCPGWTGWTGCGAARPTSAAPASSKPWTAMPRSTGWARPAGT